MLDHTLDTAHSILYVHPLAPLEQADFALLAHAVDPYIEQNGDLAGLIIESPSFPGWKSVGALVAHFRFVREHHRHVKKIALVTDSALGNIAERLAAHFVAAQIKHFAGGELEDAKLWIINPG